MVVFVFLLTAVSAVLAQSSSQIQQVMNMDPAQREQLMRQMGISESDVQNMLQEHDFGAGGAGGNSSSGQTQEDDLSRAARQAGNPMGGAVQQWWPGQGLQEPSSEPLDMRAPLDYGRRHGLQLFARGLHQGAPQISNLPVPDDYVVGSGDVFRISLFGTEAAQHRLTVMRDGWIDFPSLGPISVAGNTLAEARELISERIGREKLGVRASITLEQTRSIQLSVSGEVNRPGVYVVPSLASVIQVLNLAGGATDVGALRRVRLLRTDGTQQIDLYDFLVSGERADVVRLQPGDRLHVPSVKAAARISGSVRRPGVYEILEGETLADLLNMAGGLAPGAAGEDAVMRRYDQGGQQVFVDVPLNDSDVTTMALQDGMILRVPDASDYVAQQIELRGEVTAPGTRQWQPGMRLSNLFRDLPRDVRIGRADLDHGYIVRTDPETRFLDFLSFSLREVRRQPGSEADLQLQEEDVIVVLPQPGIVEREQEQAEETDNGDAEQQAVRGEQGQQQAQRADRRTSAGQPGGSAQSVLPAAQGAQGHAYALIPPSYATGGQSGGAYGGYGAGSSPFVPSQQQDFMARSQRQAAERPEAQTREALLEPFIEQLTRQSRDGGAIPVFTVAGEVHAPGTYPITQERALRDVISAAGGLLETADLTNAVVLRRETPSGALDVFSVDLERQRGDTADLRVKPGDVLTIRRDPSIANRVEVEVSGEVASPGTYTLPAGSTMEDLLELAGGVTKRADLRSAIFSRARLREMEEELRRRYVADIRKSLIDARVAGDQRAEVSPAVLDLLDQLEVAVNEETEGRLQIDLPRLAQGDSSADLELSDGDRLTIPSMTNAVSVAGQVRSAGSFSQVDGMTVDQYLELAGGLGPYADEDEIFILRADGSVQPVGQRSLFRASRGNDELLPGDRIVVPIEYGYINRWDLAKEVVQFVYQTGIGLAAVVAALDR